MFYLTSIKNNQYLTGIYQAQTERCCMYSCFLPEAMTFPTMKQASYFITDNNLRNKVRISR